MGRLTKEVEMQRREILVRLHCDMLEGKYPWPDGKIREPGDVNQSELLRAAHYSVNYKNAYQIFQRNDYKDAVRRELEDRKLAKLKQELPDGEALFRMKKLCNMEMMERLEHHPKDISDRDLIALRQALDKLAPPDIGDDGDGKKGRFNVSIQNLVVQLEGIIPPASLDAVKARVGITAGDVVEGSVVEDVVPPA